jgi:DNA-binding HxlR family transcriptional regulator
MVAGPAAETAPAAPPRAARHADRTAAPRTAARSAHNGNADSREACCGYYHRAVELVGRRWTGAILIVMMDGPLRFSEVRSLVPDLSDRLLSERLKELESEGIVERRVLDGSPVRAEYALTEKGEALEPTVRALKSWARDWLR